MTSYRRTLLKRLNSMTFSKSRQKGASLKGYMGERPELPVFLRKLSESPYEFRGTPRGRRVAESELEPDAQFIEGEADCIEDEILLPASSHRSLPVFKELQVKRQLGFGRHYDYNIKLMAMLSKLAWRGTNCSSQRFLLL